MPPKKRAANSDCFAGAVICLSGSLSKGRPAFEADIKAKGGKTAASVTKAVTHLVTTPAEFMGPTAKVAAALAGSIPIVSEAWLAACDAQGGLADAAPFGIGGAPVVAAAAAAAPPPTKKGKKTAAPPPAPAPAAAAAAAPGPAAKPKGKGKAAAAAAPDSASAPAAKPKGKGKAAAAAAPAPASASASAAAPFVGSIPVEKGLGESGKLSGSVSVHGDYAWLGNQVDISGGNNNNKFYRGQVVAQGKHFYAWTRWGRVGEGGQHSLDGPFGDAAGAVARFEAKFKDKTAHKWAGNQGAYPGGKKGKYSVIFEAYDASGGGGSQAAKLGAAGLGSRSSSGAGGGAAAPAAYAAAKVTGALAAFVQLVTNADMFKAQLASMGVDTAKMPLGDISARTVESGFAALLAVEAHLQASGGSQQRLAELCSAFYTYIPHNFGRSKAPLLTLSDIQAKKDMLNVLGDVGAAVASAKASTAKGRGKAKLEPAPIDASYESLGAKLVPLDHASAEFKMVQAYTDGTQGSRKCRVEEVFTVDSGGDGDRFAKHCARIGNRKLLWHGTNVAVVAAILKSGLRIMPHSGGRVGAGVYLASENGKSAGYCTAQGTTGVMFLCEAALGTQRRITQDGQVGWNDTDPVSGHGAHSCLAVGRTEPNPKKNLSFEMDGHAVTVPQGPVGPNPDLRGATSFSQSEYLVYAEAQCRIRYVLKMQFATPGGHWH